MCVVWYVLMPVGSLNTDSSWDVMVVTGISYPVWESIRGWMANFFIFLFYFIFEEGLAV